MTEPIRILIADDHAVVREGIRALVSTEADMILVGEAADGQTAVELFKTLHPDVTVLDMVMPRLDGISAIQQIKDFDQEARILVLTSFAEDDKVFPALKAGAMAYLLKDSSPIDLIKAIRDLSQGESYLDPAIARKVLAEIARPTPPAPAEDLLSEREREVLDLLAEGLPNQEIATRLVISERTVRSHVGSILAKLHLANRTQAALYAIRHKSS